MRTAALLLLLSPAIYAQDPKPPVDWNTISHKLAAVNATAEARDIKLLNQAIDEAWRTIGAEWHKQAPTPADYLRDAEAQLAANPRAAVGSSYYLAKLACQAGQMDKAESYAREALRSRQLTASSLAESIHVANIVLGLAALGRGDLAGAKTFLFASTQITGTTILDRWGPDLALAKALLEKGQNEVVLTYFQQCKSFVTKNPKLDDWIAMLTGGRAPDLSHEYLWY